MSVNRSMAGGVGILLFAHARDPLDFVMIDHRNILPFPISASIYPLAFPVISSKRTTAER